MNLSEEEMNTLIGSIESFKDAIDEMVNALCKAIKPVLDAMADIMAKSLEESRERVIYKAIKHNTPYKRVFYNRVYDKRIKLHKCRNNCRKRRNV